MANKQDISYLLLKFFHVIIIVYGLCNLIWGLQKQSELKYIHHAPKGKVVSPKRSRHYQYDNDETNMPFILLYQFS